MHIAQKLDATRFVDDGFNRLNHGGLFKFIIDDDRTAFRNANRRSIK